MVHGAANLRAPRLDTACAQTDGWMQDTELVGWDALLDDARARNQAFFDRAGISGNSYFSPD